jgi:hypothetical protein
MPLEMLLINLLFVMLQLLEFLCPWFEVKSKAIDVIGLLMQVFGALILDFWSKLWGMVLSCIIIGFLEISSC